ncbi:CDP-alcohol phosphatidyltransferase family protein [Acidipropionibacterium virtanenii]|uniref:CDP-alcohol phosphatidyltransferase family protein n=1 Tax=Acidipropionibacterium virtanenii TaxID=2057246 RepID=UPI001FE8B8D2|nr:CDP-alcohol phosphatidyltransferase family protein [Acidipropionibacterium virtanenii]
MNRPVGRVFAAALNELGLTPNQVSLVSAAFTAVGIVLLATVHASVWLGVVVWLLLAVGYALDSADGQVARLRGGGSVAGEWLDHVIDAFKAVCLPLAAAVGWYRFFPLEHDSWLLVPLVLAVATTVEFFGMILNDLLKARQGVPQATEQGGSSIVRSLMGLPTDYGVVCFSFVLWGFPRVFVIVYALLTLAEVAYVALALPTWFARMRRL